MGMTTNQLIVKRIDYIVDGEFTALLRDDGMKDDLQEQVTQFFPEHGSGSGVYGFHDLVCFFQEISLEAFMGLFGVPGASPRPAQAAHESHQGIEFAVIRRHFFSPCE
jgi:hypothetical protein